MWRHVHVCVSALADVLHVVLRLRTFDGQVAVEIVGGTNRVQNFNVMAGHVEVTEREILLRASSEVVALPEVKKDVRQS